MAWPGVTTRNMFGSRCYQAKGKLFAFFSHQSIVLTSLPDEEREILMNISLAEPFIYGKITTSKWLRVPLDDLDLILEFTEKSYQNALAKTV